MKHQVEFDNSIEVAITMASSYGKGEDKQLLAVVEANAEARMAHGFFRVVNHGAVELQTENLDAAVGAYNSL